MSESEKRKLVIEADLQTNEINKLKIWLRNAIATSTIGFVITFWGIQKANLCSVFGGIILLLSLIVAVIINMGIKNGRLNVDKILKLIELN